GGRPVGPPARRFRRTGRIDHDRPRRPSVPGGEAPRPALPPQPAPPGSPVPRHPRGPGPGIPGPGILRPRRPARSGGRLARGGAARPAARPDRPSEGPSMSRLTKPTVIVLGMMGRTPFAGVAWQVLHYLEGFRRLGCEVYYVEDTGDWPYDP